MRVAALVVVGICTMIVVPSAWPQHPPTDADYINVLEEQIRTLASELSDLRDTFKAFREQAILEEYPVTPRLAYKGPEKRGKFIRYRFTITNRHEFPDQLFAPSPELPSIGTNRKASRTQVHIYDAHDNHIYGFAAFSRAQNLDLISFSRKKDVTPPRRVYVVLHDRKLDRKYISNLATIITIREGFNREQQGMWWLPLSDGVETMGLAPFRGPTGDTE